MRESDDHWERARRAVARRPAGGRGDLVQGGNNEAMHGRCAHLPGARPPLARKCKYPPWAAPPRRARMRWPKKRSCSTRRRTTPAPRARRRWPRRGRPSGGGCTSLRAAPAARALLRDHRVPPLRRVPGARARNAEATRSVAPKRDKEATLAAPRRRQPRHTGRFSPREGSRRTGLANPLRQHHSGGIATSLLVRPGQRRRQGGQRARHAPDLEGGAKAPRRGPERRRARSKKKRRRSAGGKPAHMKRASGSPKRRSPRALDLRLKHQTPSGTPG